MGFLDKYLMLPNGEPNMVLWLIILGMVVVVSVLIRVGMNKK